MSLESFAPASAEPAPVPQAPDLAGTLERLTRSRPRGDGGGRRTDRCDPRDPAELRRQADAAAEEDLRERPFTLDSPDEDADAVSIAWEESVRTGCSWVAAKWAARREVRLFGLSRVMHESACSPLSEAPRRGTGAQLRSHSAEWMTSPKHKPEEEAGQRVDIQAWRRHLPPWQDWILSLLEEGYTVAEISEVVGRKPMAVYLAVYAIRSSWAHFNSLSAPVKREARPLTDLQRTVLRLFAARLTDVEIAERLGTSRGAVSVTKQAAMRKLGAFTQRAVAEAISGGDA